MNKEDTIIELLNEILLWMKYDYLDTKNRLKLNLDSEEKIIAYELSTGENSTYDISKKISVSATTVSNWWSKWFDEGIMEQTEKYGGNRYKKLCSLTKFGIKIPEI